MINNKIYPLFKLFVGDCRKIVPSQNLVKRLPDIPISSNRKKKWVMGTVLKVLPGLELCLETELK